MNELAAKHMRKAIKLLTIIPEKGAKMKPMSEYVPKIRPTTEVDTPLACACWS